VTEHTTRHDDLAPYLLGALTPEEHASFERHLESCAACRAELLELRGPARLLARAAPAYELPRALEGRTFAAIEREAAPAPRPLLLRPPRRRRPRLAAAAAVAAAAVLAFAAGTQLDRPAGPVELRTALVAPGRDGSASVEVRKTGIGRVIRFDSDDLPILPKGEYYELWFVGPGDTLADPNRISAGTFHPDERGRSHVRFAAAVDPSKYPVLSVTAEPGDGNPERTGPEVLRSEP
jgi:anti-sigma-K factor RskA/putative zinc finger protein